MRFVSSSAALAASLALSACGGGGGSVGSTPPPAPVPAPVPAPTPTPTPAPPAGNTLITDLRSSQTFDGEATTTMVTLTRSDGHVQSTSAVRDTLSVRYDAATRTYTVETAGRSQSFGPGDAGTPRFPGEAVYSKAMQSEYLTLVTNPYFGAEFSNRYVGMGYWQKNELAASTQDTRFSTFTYGLGTTAANMPRTGAAHWLTDIFGLLTVPGNEVRTIQGLGDFEVDFAAGAFKTRGYMDEYLVVTNGGATGALTFQAGGQLDSGNGFSGLFSYSGHFPGVLHGTLTGSFFGPIADEIGATFNATGLGMALTGALTGQRFPVGSTSDGIRNISLTNPLASQRLTSGVGADVSATTQQGLPGFRQVTSGWSGGSVEFTLSGPSTVGFQYAYTPQLQDVVPGRANFTTYQSTVAGNPVTVSYYKIGSANQEVALTYSSFVTWTWGRPFGSDSDGGFQANYMVYGIETPRDLLSGRSGTASYDGIVYGKGANYAGTVFDVGGTSRFEVDFSGERYSGWLDLTGTTLTGTLSQFGRFTFDAALAAGTFLEAPLQGAVSPDGGSYIRPQFYGPTGQEIGAGFKLRMGEPGTPERMEAGGITVAKAR